MIDLSVIKTETYALALGGVRRNFVAQEAFPQIDRTHGRLKIDKGLVAFRRIRGPFRRCHHHRQPWIFKP